MVKKEEDDAAMEVDELADDSSEAEDDNDMDWGDLTTDTEDEPVGSIINCILGVFCDEEGEAGLIRVCGLCK